MPNQSSNLTTLRAGNHACNIYVSVMDGISVLEGELSADPETASALNVAYTLTSGDAADVYPAMRVMFYSSAGDFKGMTSVRAAGTISSVNLPIREVSWGEIQLVTGDVFTVYDDFLPTDRLPAADSSFSPDHTTYTDQTSNPAPIPTSGGHYAYMLPASGSIDIPFVGSNSYTLDPDSGGDITHSWYCASGTWDDDTAEDPTLTLTSAGKYLVIHTTTDDDNTKTEVQFIRIRIHDADDPPYECDSVSVQGDDATGFSASFRLFENASLSDIPDGIMVIVWAQHFVDGVETSFGNIVPSRSHILCTGFLQRDRGSGTDDRGDELEFDVISPLARYTSLPGFSKALIRADSPTDWTGIKGMTIRRAIAHLFRNYTNIHQLFDVVFSDFDDADYPALYLQKANIWEQIKELADSRGGRIVADMAGRIEIQERIDLSSLLERTAFPTISTIGGLDALGYDITREHIPVLDTYRMRGFKAAAANADTTTYLVRFPSSPGRGPASPVTEKAVFDDLSHAFQQVALRGAAESRVFFTADGVQHHAPEGTFTLPGLYAHLFQFYREMFYLAVGFGSALRGADLSPAAFRWIPRAISIDFADGTLTTTLSARAETSAPESGGVEDPITAGTVTITEPEFSYPSPTLTPEYSSFGLASIPVDLAAMNTDGKLYLLTNGSSLRYGGTPEATGYALGLTGTPQDFTVRADSPLYINTGDTVNAHIVTTTRYYSIADLAGSRTLSNTTTLSGSTSPKQMQFERGNPDWGIIAWYTYLAGVIIRYTTDGGATWSAEIVVSSHYDTTAGNSIPPGLWLDPAGNGTAYVTAYTNTATGLSLNAALYKTTNYGATWAVSTDFSADPGDVLSPAIVRGFDDSAYLYTTRTTASVGYDPRLYRNGTDISPDIAGDDYGMNVAFRGFSVADGDANTGVLCGLANYSGSGSRAVFRTYNLRATVPTWTQLTAADIDDARRVYAVNRTTYYLIGVSGYLAYVSDGTTVNEAVISGAGEFVGLAGL